MRDERGLFGSMRETLNLIYVGFDIGHTDLLFWMYVDTDVNYDPLFGCCM